MEPGGAGKAGAADLAGGDDGFRAVRSEWCSWPRIITLQCDEKRTQIVFLLCSRGQHPVDIAREDVDLDIQLSSGVNFARSRLLRGVGDDVDREMGRAVLGVAHVVDGQRHAVERDRPLGAIIGAEIARDADADSGRIAFRADTDTSPTRIDMAGDDMAAELVAEPQRALEVEPRAFAPLIRRGARQRFRPKRRPRTSPRPCRPRSGTRPSRRSTRRDRPSRGRSRSAMAAAGRRAARRCARCRRR